MSDKPKTGVWLPFPETKVETGQIVLCRDKQDRLQLSQYKLYCEDEADSGSYIFDDLHTSEYMAPDTVKLVMFIEDFDN